MNPAEFDLEFADPPSTHPTTGTTDDADDSGDEREDENEAPIAETDELTEAPEEFVKDGDEPDE